MLRKKMFVIGVIFMMARPYWAYADQQACDKERDVFHSLARSQSKLGDFFARNQQCTQIQNHGQTTTMARCESILKCRSSAAFNSAVPESENALLRSEAYQLILRQSLASEMKKYNDQRATNMRSMLAYLKTLPVSYKEKIKQCKAPRAVSDTCTNHPSGDKFVKSLMIEDYHNQITSDSVEDSPRIQAQAAVRLKRSQKVAEKVTDSIEPLFRSMMEDEASSDADIEPRLKADSLEMDSDAVLAKLSSEMLEHHLDISNPEKIKSFVRNTLLTDFADGDDPVLSYDKERLARQLDNALSKVTFESSDFSPNNINARNSLLAKLSDVRVMIANDFIAQDCDIIDLTLGEVCAKIDENLKSENIVNMLNMKSENLVEIMINHHRWGSSEDTETKEAILSKLLIVQKGNNPHYQEYLSLLIEASACEMKLNRGGFDQVMEAIAKKAESNAIKSCKDSIKEASVSFYDQQDDLRKKGIKLDPSIIGAAGAGTVSKEALSIPLGTPVTDNNVSAAPSDPTSDSKAFVPVQGATASQANKSFDPSMNDAISTFGNDNKKTKNVKEANDSEAKMRSKLAELEAKEKAVSKKLSDATSEKEIKGRADELQSLRDQIEELKSSNAAVSKKDKSISKDNGSSSSNVASKNASIQNKANSALIAKNDDYLGRSNFEKQIAPQSLAQISAYSGADSSGASSASGASSHSIAPVVSANPGDKSKNASGMGIVLTKMGDPVFDASSVLENPKDGDIMILIEQTKGQPFLIRENGILVKVSVKLDSSGKPKLGKNGKPLIDKLPLTKSQGEKLIKEVNASKSLKEIEDHTRLYELRALIKGAVQRN